MITRAHDGALTPQEDVPSTDLADRQVQLAAAPTSVALPTDRPRSAVQTVRAATHPFMLPPTLRDALRTLGQQEDVTLGMTLLAVFQALLHRYTGQDDVVVGTWLGPRARPEGAGPGDCCAPTVTLRSDLSGDPTVRELLRRVRDVAAAPLPRPCARRLAEVPPTHGRSGQPLVPVLFVFQPATPGTTAGSARPLDPWLGTTETARPELSVCLQETEAGLAGTCAYNADLFEATTIARLIAHFQALLEGSAAGAEQRLSELELLSEEERRQLLVVWNATQAAYPRNLCLHQLFEPQVARTPEAVAVVHEGARLTYQELNDRANQLARHLQGLGVGPEVLVGLCVERSLEMVIALLGILKAGGAYVPLDPAYPKERLAFMLRDARAPVLLTQERLVATLPAHPGRVVCLDADWDCIMARRTARSSGNENPLSAVTSDNLAYVIYTSGSTGRPKGVAIRHQCAVNFVHWAGTAFPRADLAGVLATTSLCFDLAVFELFAPLSWGGTVILAENALHVPALASAQDATLLNTVPSAITELLRIGGIPAAVRVVNLAGEPLSRALVEQLYGQTSVRCVHNLYGPTETTTYSTYTPVERGIKRNPTLGRPIANTQLYVLDKHRQPVPIGVVGELYIGGDGLARGYLNRPELTAEKFVVHPFSAEPGARLYRTGDLARYRPDGTLEFRGRTDHQVKIRGFRIELGEVEAVLAQHPAVRQAVVVAREDTPGDKRLVAYVVPRPEQAPTPGELRRCARERLPDYMVPAAVVLLEALPLTPNGKVDRRALPAPRRSRSQADATFVAPTLLMHQQLDEIWEDLLDVRPIGIRDDFFALGGHSLLAVRMVERMEQVWGKKVALATLFAGPTIEQLAQALLEPRGDETGPRAPVVALRTGGSKRPFFFLHGHWLGTAYYCFPLARALGPDQPFYALDPYRLDDLPVPPSLETIAAAHLEAVRAIQPDGPYLLGGYCNGALLAYEMARQLHAQGQAVDLLVLMDPMPLPQTYRRWLKGLRAVVGRGGALVRLSAGQQVVCFARLRRLLEQLYSYLVPHRRNNPGGARPPLASFIVSAEAVQQDYQSKLDWAVLAYRPPSVYPGPITFFWPANEPWHSRWWRLVAEATAVEAHILPGTQITWRTNHLPALAERLRLCLTEAHAVAGKEPASGRQASHEKDGAIYGC